MVRGLELCNSETGGVLKLVRERLKGERNGTHNNLPSALNVPSNLRCLVGRNKIERASENWYGRTTIIGLSALHEAGDVAKDEMERFLKRVDASGAPVCFQPLGDDELPTANL